MAEEISVYLADDHALVREGIAALIFRTAGMRVVGQAGDGLRVVEDVLALKPDVVALDLIMPGLNGLEVCRQIRRRSSSAVLVITMHTDEELMVSALRNGASGYLLKGAAAEQLIEGIRAVAKGDLYLGPGVPRTILTRLGVGQEDPYELLTLRERQVLQQIAEGRTSREIAELFGLSSKTVDTHRAHLMAKLNIHDQTSLVKYAIRKGIISA